MIDLRLDKQANPILWHSVIGPLRRWRIMQRSCGVRRVHCRYFGADFLVDLQDGYGFDVATRRFEHGDLARLVMALQRLRPKVFVDIGACWGIYSCIVGSLDPAIRIVSLEPDPERFVLLERQIAHQGLSSRATLIQAAAGAEHGSKIDLMRGENGMIQVTQQGSGYCRAPLVALDSLDLPREQCVALKIDVDEYELEVFRGGSDFFKQNHGYAVVEAMGENVHAVVDWMAAAGWRMVERYGINAMFEKP
jgi:FkbM family methyltransferase